MLGRLGPIPDCKVRGPAAEVKLGIQRCAEEIPVADAPIPSVETAFKLAKHGDQFVQVVRGDDPVGVFGVLLKSVLDTGHAGG